ncbi:hypothetical protein SDC9_185419 [bioreactor metagenome]|uniref:F5/8 type C domain-containing protein n=1 Tax=bioreactor metagenome TaxID=1076179 RepID=A0A645HFU2_9ZZZZ
MAYNSSIPPTPSGDSSADRYPDDLAMLTDGTLSVRSYTNGCVGFRTSRSYIIDLADPQMRYSSITCHSLGGGDNNVLAPAGIKASVSEDLASWRKVAEIAPADRDEKKLEYRPLKLEFPETTGRFIKLEITPRSGWCFLSEITVD